MLRLPPFSYRTPVSLEEAAAILDGEGPRARPVAGGTDLWPNMKRRHQRAETVVSLMRIDSLRGIRSGDENEKLTIGATTRLSDVLASEQIRRRYPALARAVAAISSPPLRNMGTIGGNVCLDTRCTYYNQTEEWRRSIDYCMKEAGTICWVAPSSPRCWAHSASDSAPILAALGASVRLVSAREERTIPVADLFREDGIRYLRTRPEEILTEIVLPADADADRCRSSFLKLRRRGAIDFAVLSVAASLWMSPDGFVEKAEIVLGAVASAPKRVEGVGQYLIGRRLDEEPIATVGEMARRVSTPMDNTDFQTQWRGLMVARYTEAALREIAGKDLGVMPPAHNLQPE